MRDVMRICGNSLASEVRVDMVEGTVSTFSFVWGFGGVKWVEQEVYF